MSPRIIDGLDGLRDLVGEHLGYSEWIDVTQDVIDTFGDVTHDRHWIHMDPARAVASGMQSTIAHGYYSLSLIGGLMQQIYRIDPVGTTLNYGIERARLTAPVPVDSQVRLSMTLDKLTDVGAAVNAYFACTIEIRGQERPAAVSQIIIRYHPAGE